jgi:hypothetical protein
MPLSVRTVVLLVVAGLATGIVLGLLTSALAAGGPSGEGWSLKGNGALIVPFGLGPALLAGGWATLVAHFRSMPRWPVVGLAAGVAGVALVLISLLALVIGGSGGAGVAAVGILLTALWMLAAPLVIAMLPRSGMTPAHERPNSHLVAAAALPAAVVAGLYLAQRVSPPGS